MSFYVYLLQFLYYTIHSLSVETMYPPGSQEFYNTNSDSKINTVDDKFSVVSKDHFIHLLTIEGNFLSLLRLCALEPGSGFESCLSHLLLRDLGWLS